MEILPEGQAGAQLMRQMLEQAPLPDRHAVAVRNIHTTSGASDRIPFEASRLCMQVCRDLIEQGVPCSRPDAQMYAGVAMLAFSWPEQLREETAELFRLYIRRGYVRLNDAVDAFGAENYSVAFKPGNTPLEVAIRKGNLPAAVVLVEEGDRLDARPNVKTREYADMLEMALDWWLDGADQWRSQLTAAAMRHRISLSAAPSPCCAESAGAIGAARRRRAAAL